MEVGRRQHHGRDQAHPRAERCDRLEHFRQPARPVQCGQRGGDQDAAKSLPQHSQALLTAAADAATSRQELDRIQAQTAASLQQTYNAITAFGAAASSQSDAARLAAAATAQAAAGGSSNDNAVAMADLRAGLQAVVDQVDQMQSENNAGNAAIAGNTGRVAKKLDDVTGQSRGDAISVVASEPVPVVAAA